MLLLYTLTADLHTDWTISMATRPPTSGCDAVAATTARPQKTMYNAGVAQSLVLLQRLTLGNVRVRCSSALAATQTSAPSETHTQPST